MPLDLAGAGAFLQGAGALGSLFGGGGLSARKSAALQAQYNRETMQNQLQWRAADAEKAGISKHWAMGAPVASFSPSISGGGDSAIQRISDAGQSIGRAAQAYSDSRSRKILFDQEVRMNELKIKDAEISLQKNASDLAVSSSGRPPALNGVLTKPSETTYTRTGDISMERAPPAPAVKEFVNRDGTVSIWPSADAKQAIEDSLYEYEHMYRNRIVPSLRRHGASISRAWRKAWWNPNRERR